MPQKEGCPRDFLKGVNLSKQKNPDFAVIVIRSDVGRPIEAVWSIVGGFFDLGKWLDVDCSVIAGNGGVGSVRQIGAEIVEPMIAATRFSYSYVQSAGPMADHCYHGTLACEPSASGGTMIAYTLVYDQSAMEPDVRVSIRARLDARFSDAVNAMSQAVMA